MNDFRVRVPRNGIDIIDGSKKQCQKVIQKTHISQSKANKTNHDSSIHYIYTFTLQFKRFSITTKNKKRTVNESVCPLSLSPL